MDEPALGALPGIYRYTWSKNSLLLHHVSAALRDLAAAHIPTMILDGAALVALHYHDAGLCTMSAFDVAVPVSLASSAGSVLERAGWRPVLRPTPSVLAMRHSGLLMGHDGQRCDLHWRILAGCGGADADDELWAAAVGVELLGVPTRALAPADQLLHVCVEGASRAPTPGLRWVADALVIIEAGGIDWPRLVEQAARREFVLRMRETLEYLRTVRRAAIPDGALEALAALPISRLERLEYRVRQSRHPLLGELAGHWCKHRRAGRRGLVAAAFTFPRYLQHAWGTVGGIRAQAVSRGMRRLRMALRG